MNKEYRDDETDRVFEPFDIEVLPETPRRRHLSRFHLCTACLLALVVVLAIWTWIASPSTVKDALASIPLGFKGSVSEAPNDANVTLVVACMAKDNTSWFDEHFPHWDIVKYVTDDPHAENLVPVNKGREGMVYLTYIVDHYDALADSDIIVFSHADRYQWHNDDPLFDGARMLSHLRFPYIRDVGYTSLRCKWEPGCPSSLHPLEHGSEPLPEGFNMFAQDAVPWLYQPAFEEMFPNEPAPATVGAPCCAQFAVSADTILQRPLEDYRRVRQWLIDGYIFDGVSGRIMEYVWHILFQKPAVNCPSAADCYCRLYGKCRLSCPDEGICDGQVPTSLPGGGIMPETWPEFDLDGNPQDVARLRKAQEKFYQPL